METTNEMEIWGLITLPHIKYITAPGHLYQVKKGVYVGGGSDNKLIVNKQYKLYTVAYSPLPDKQRIIVWAASDNKGNTIYHVNLANFKIIKL